MKKMLHIEDSDDDAYLHERILKEEYEITRVKTLAEGLERVGKERFDVILSDLKLSDSAATETIKRIKEKCPSAFILAISGNEDPELTDKVLRENASGFFLKGFHDTDPNMFLTAIRCAYTDYTKRETLNLLREAA